MNIKKEIDFAGKKLTLESGDLALRADMAVKATYGDTVVLATAVSGGPNPDLDYFPLQVNYEERLYASGTIKSSRFMKRDGRPTDTATTTRRLIDRAIRPLFSKDFMDEVQVVITILSLDEESDPAFVGTIAASAALHASNIPWNGPLVGCRVGYVNEDYVLNPSREQIENESDLDMMAFFSGAERQFLSLDAKVNLLPEEKVLGAIEHAHNKLDVLVKLIEDFAKEANPKGEKYEYVSRGQDPEITEAVSEFAKDRVIDILENEKDPVALYERKGALLDEVYAKFEGTYKKSDMEKAFASLQKKAILSLAFEKNKRHDGRAFDEVRKLESKVGLLPRTHGSGLFTRGHTQALTIATLGSPSLELLVHDMYGERTKRYIHYYNFPPYSVGEVGRIGGAGSREIGHGMLAEKALEPVIPSQDDFPYTVLLMTEILTSNGSSSMAATCGSTLALMDAGVPIKDMVAGIAMGLIANEDESDFIILTDLDGTEDAYGCMDFKMTGTKDAITAIQVDIKLKGLPMSLLPNIVEESTKARHTVLESMTKAISKPKESLSPYAPKMGSIKIDPDQIGMVIGSGGKTIKEIQERTGTELGIEDDGSVFVSGDTDEAVQEAITIVENMTRIIEVGDEFEGVVEELADFGAFVEILPGKTGLLHVSEIASDYVSNVADYLSVGDKIKVKVIDVNVAAGKISLSKRAIDDPEGYENNKSNHRSNGNDRRNGRGPRGRHNNRRR